MSIRVRPQIVVFDVVETLASLDAVADRLGEFGLDRAVLEGWFTRLLRDGMAFTAAGGSAGFAEVAASALHTQTHGACATRSSPTSSVRRARRAAGCCRCRPCRCRGRHPGVHIDERVSCHDTEFLERAGLAAHVDGVLSIDEVGAWKPAAAVYQHALRSAGVPAERAAMIAVHAWDLFGARQAGLTTGWCSRLEGSPVRLFGSADVTAGTLDAVVTALAALPNGT